MMTEPTDAEIDAATLAYVGSRWKTPEMWRDSYPQQYAETRARIADALRAAAKVRSES